MSQFRLAHLGLILAAFGFNMAPPLLGLTSSSAYAADTLRPEVGKPLQAAAEMMKQHKTKEALAKVREADAVGGKTAFEAFTVDRMRASVASAAGDNDLAIKSFESIIASGRLGAGEQIKYIASVASLYYTTRNYAKASVWISRYIKEGGTDPTMRSLLTQTYYQSGDFARAAKEVGGEVASAEKGGRKPSEEQLQLLANCASKLNDKAGYITAMEKLVAHYPKKEYWEDLLNRVTNKPGFSGTLALDVYRLKLVTGQLNKPGDFMEMAQLSLQAGHPAEAKKIVEQGYQSKALGSGADISRQQRLRDLAIKNAGDEQKAIGQTEADAVKAMDATAMMAIGYSYVSFGQFDKGIGLMEKGVKLGSVKRIEDAKLHLGMAYWQANRKSDALQMLKTVKGTDGAADLAHYWITQINHPLSQ